MKPTMVVLIAALVGIAAFFGGIQYQKMQVPSFGAGRFSQGQTRTGTGTGNRALNMRPVTGEIINQDSSSFTVKMNDGSTKIVILSNSTAYMTSSAAAKTDVKTGQKVMVIGTQNADGSVTAQSVQLNPIGRAFGEGNPSSKQ